ncbi:Ribosome biogenesis protein brx1 [Sorochytrium milnesiophthora]
MAKSRKRSNGSAQQPIEQPEASNGAPPAAKASNGKKNKAASKPAPPPPAPESEEEDEEEVDVDGEDEDDVDMSESMGSDEEGEEEEEDDDEDDEDDYDDDEEDSAAKDDMALYLAAKGKSKVSGQSQAAGVSKADKAEMYRRIAKQRVLLLSSRGISQRYRHLINDLEALMPHVKRDAKLDSKQNLDLLNELCELHNCNNCMYFEARHTSDLYMWLSKAPNGPSVKFQVLNVHTMDEMKLTGNHLKWSRPILSFDAAFDAQPHLQLLKEMLQQVFNTPRGARKSKPFFDHVLSFTIADNKVWFRNYQISETAPRGAAFKADNVHNDCTLTEVGPRFVLDPIKIFRGSFGGQGVWQNQDYVTPAAVRRVEREQASGRFAERASQKADFQLKKGETKMPENPLSVDVVFK